MTTKLNLRTLTAKNDRVDVLALMVNNNMTISGTLDGKRVSILMMMGDKLNSGTITHDNLYDYITKYSDLCLLVISITNSVGYELLSNKGRLQWLSWMFSYRIVNYDRSYNTIVLTVE